MPLDFICLGLVLIISAFKKHKKDFYSITFFICGAIIMISYFVASVSYSQFNINYLAFLSVFVLGFVNLFDQKNLISFFSCVILNGVFYVLLIWFNLYFLVEFNYLPYLIIMIVLGGALVRNLNLSLSYICFSLILNQIISLFFALKHFTYFSFFGPNTVKVFAFSCFTIWIINNLLNMPLFRRKTCSGIVVCKSKGVCYEKD